MFTRDDTLCYAQWKYAVFFWLFHQVMSSCFEIFATWDDEYEKLQTLLRDIVKKKKEDSDVANRADSESAEEKEN